MHRWSARVDGKGTLSVSHTHTHLHSCPFCVRLGLFVVLVVDVRLGLRGGGCEVPLLSFGEIVCQQERRPRRSRGCPFAGTWWTGDYASWITISPPGCFPPPPPPPLACHTDHVLQRGYCRREGEIEAVCGERERETGKIRLRVPEQQAQHHVCSGRCGTSMRANIGGRKGDSDSTSCPATTTLSVHGGVF